jgi:lipopolysaccharide export system protein LptA
LFLLLTVTAVMAQRVPVKKTKIDLINSEKAEYIKGADGKWVGHIRKGIFKQDYSTLTADSTLFYRDENRFESFGHVNINQGDTLNIFADKLDYNGNTKIAILTNNVKMVDKDATLTTNYFVYHTDTRFGTYTGGGKLVNKDNTLTSKNGYYFAGSRDAYFRYDVIGNTAEAIIKTDTMRYNSGTRITYFYGPTNIYGKKDKDTLYTENGNYNTQNDQALFGKNNLYKQGSKSLKGDSLFYDRVKGYGLATRNVVFNDNEQKITIYGHKGEYYKAEEKAQITINPYMVFVTEEKDTTKTAQVIKPDSLNKAGAKALADSAVTKLSAPKNTIPVTTKSAPVNIKTPANPALIAKTAEPIKRDSLFMGADTLETRIITLKELKELQFLQWLANNKDTSIKITPPYKTAPKVLTIKPPKMPVDSSIYHRDIFGKPKQTAVVQKKPAAVKPIVVLTAKDSLVLKQKADSIELKKNNGLRDTSRFRIVSAFHRAKLYRSDLQAVADSMFYSSSDSTIRSYKNPMIWTQGSQLSGDTIHLQMKNKKLDNIDLFPSGFIVNVEKTDSLHFNQLAGKKIHGNFKDNKLSLLLVTGNAETIYYSRDSVTNEATDMTHTTSGSFRANFKNGKANVVSLIQSNTTTTVPLKDVKDEDKILKGFIWKPKDRPASKEAILPPLAKSTKIKATPSKSTPLKKPAAKAGATKKTVSANKNTTIPKTNKETITRDKTAVTPSAVIKKDTVAKKQ